MGPHVDLSIIRRTYSLMQPLQAPRTDLAVSQDVSYGEDALQKLDLYAPKEGAAGPRPIVIFVHGGGFTAGDKGSADNVASYFARHGMLGVSTNYRLAPAATWPEQSLDVGDAVAWLNANAVRYGADPHRIIVIGYSSAASVVASYLFDQSIKTTRDGVLGGVLMSGFGYAGNSPVYYGDDPAKIVIAESGRRGRIDYSPIQLMPAARAGRLSHDPGILEVTRAGR